MQKIKYLDFSKEYKLRGDRYMKVVDRVLKSGIYILGQEVIDFENNFSRFLGIKNCIGVANGLEALQISLMSLNIGHDDEVITTPISAVATTLAIIATGATPIFVDVDENGQIDVTKIEKSITKNTKAILPVDLYGQPCELVEIRKICKRNNLYLVEDACQAHGSSFQGEKLGTYGDIGCFSFYPTKNLGAFGDGGAIVTNNNKLAKAARQIRDYGQESKYVHTRYGLNSRLDEVHAALLNVKLDYLNKDNNTRRKIAKRYLRNLGTVNELQIVLPKEIGDSNFHIFAIKTKRRNDLQRFLKERGISTLIHYPLIIPDQMVIKEMKFKIDGCPVAKEFVNEVLSIPCNPFQKISDIDYISNEIIKFFS